MDKTCEEIVSLINVMSPQFRGWLAAGLTILALHFTISFGESLGKALFYLTH
jgi:hypothetical protein